VLVERDDLTVNDGVVVPLRPLTTLENRRFKLFWLRDQSCARRPALRPIARKPSSFSS
jgi:hypothetical protein